MMSLPLPNEKACLALLEKYETPDHIVRHCIKVREVGKVLADGLIRNNYHVDLELVTAACLLHDIAKYPCILDRGKGYHDSHGEKMLNEECLPLVAGIVAQHVILKDQGDGPVKEEHLVNYADKRVVHDRIVSLDERFQYLADTYGKNPKALELLDAMKRKTFDLEARIFELLDFRPEDLIRLVEDNP